MSETQNKNHPNKLLTIKEGKELKTKQKMLRSGLKGMEQYHRLAGILETLNNEPITTDVHLTIQ